MNKFVAAIKAQESWRKKPKPPRENVMVNRRPPVKESEIMQILTMHEMGNMLIDVKNGKKWYKYLGF